MWETCNLKDNTFLFVSMILDQDHKIISNIAYCFKFQSYSLLIGVAQSENGPHCALQYKSANFFLKTKMGRESVSLTTESQEL